MLNQVGADDEEDDDSCRRGHLWVRVPALVPLPPLPQLDYQRREVEQEAENQVDHVPIDNHLCQHLGACYSRQRKGCQLMGLKPETVYPIGL